MAQHNELGKKGEDFAAEQLQKDGYKILERNWRSGKCELDIVAEKDDTIVVVEVKTRRNNLFADPTQSIGIRKIKMLLKGVSAYIEENNIQKDFRIDVFTIVIKDTQTNSLQFEHIEDAINFANIPLSSDY